MYGACAACPKHSVSTTINISSPDGCRCGSGYFMGYNSKALGGEESYVIGLNGLVYKLHTFNTYNEGILVVVEAALAISCNGVPTSPPILWRPAFYPPVATQSTCPLPMVMSYPVDIMMDESETSTHMQCVPCPKGTYSAQGGTEGDCLPCPSGQYQENSGRSSCEGCPPGTYTSNGGDTCIPCQLGTFQVGNMCVPCADGFFTLGMAVTACIPCPNNMWSNNRSGGCRNCPPGATSPGGTGVDGCRCSGGLTLFLFRNTPYCLECDRGTFAPSGANQCFPCPAGTFSNRSGLDSCYPCQTTPVIQVSSLAATECTACGPGTIPDANQSACIPCPIGKYCEGNSSMEDCPLGTFSVAENLSSLQQCPPCPANFYCPSVTIREQCPIGTYSSEGSTNKHQCQCTDQYNCVYSTVTTKKILLDLTPEEFEARRTEFIAALAASLGVSPDKIRIISVQAPSSDNSGLRRKWRLGSPHKRLKNQTLVLAALIEDTQKKRGRLRADLSAGKRLRELGWPAVTVTAFFTESNSVAF